MGVEIIGLVGALIVFGIVATEVTGAGTGTVTFGVDGAGGTEVAAEVPLPWTKITVDGEVLREGKSNGTYLAVSLSANAGTPA